MWVIHNKTTQEYKNSKKQEKLDVSIRINWTNLDIAFGDSKICQEERRLTKYSVTKNSKLLIIQSISDINANFNALIL